jgi:hypothetical protein
LGERERERERERLKKRKLLQRHSFVNYKKKTIAFFFFFKTHFSVSVVHFLLFYTYWRHREGTAVLKENLALKIKKEKRKAGDAKDRDKR